MEGKMLEAINHVKSISKKIHIFKDWLRSTRGNTIGYRHEKIIDKDLVTRDIVNRAMKGLNPLASRLIKQTTEEANRLAQWRIRQKINEGGQQIDKIAPKIIRGAIEDVSKAPFRLLSTLGRDKLSQVKKSWTRQLGSSQNNVWSKNIPCLLCC